MRRILLILGLILVTVGIAAGMYFLFFRTPSAPPIVNAPTNAPTGGGLPTAGTGGPPTNAGGAVTGLPAQPAGPSPIANGGITQVTAIETSPTSGASISSTGGINYYNRLDGKFYKFNPDGSVGSLSNKVFFDVQNATFDNGGGKAILEYPDGSNILFDFNSGSQVTLPKHWEDFSFNPGGDQIAAKSIGVDPSNRFLVVSNADGSSARAVQELGENADKVEVNWSPNNQIIATAQTGDFFGPDRKEIFFVGQNQENFRSLVVEGLDFRPAWSPSGSQLLYSSASSLSDYKPLLWIVDASGDNIGRNRRSVSVNTWADKCTFGDENTVFCAVPTVLDRGAGLQPGLSDTTPDDLVRIDLTTGLQTKIATPDGSHTVEKLLLSPDGSSLFFTDKGSGILNKVQLR